MAPLTTRAVLLRAYDYGETSRIFRFYTRDRGLLGIMAKGVRGRSGKGGSALATFTTGDLTAYVKPNRDLHTMKDFAGVRARGGLGGHMLRFGGASAVAELVVAHTEQESNPDLFEALETALDTLEGAGESLLPTACLSALWQVVAALGFAPEVDHCVRCGRSLTDSDEMGRFDAGAGGVRCAGCGADAAGPRLGPGARDQLIRLLEGRLDPPVDVPRRHLSLLSDFVAFHVASRPLKSLHFLGDILPTS
ncbi:MAG: DNA repair protein RecO [Longimicrobiales bacterium]